MDIEYTILHYLREKEIFEKLSPYIEEKTIFSEKGQKVFSAIKEMMKKGPEEGKWIKCKEIKVYLSSDRTISRGEMNELKKYIKYIRRAKVSNKNILLEICKEFIEKNLWRGALERFLPYLNKKGLLPIDEIEEVVENTKKVRDSFGEKKGYDYSRNLSRSKVRDDPGAVELPLKGISLFPGELGIWAGGPKAGKTCALVNTGYSGCRQGKRVLHCTLELPADWLALRYDGRAINKPYKQVAPEDSAKAVKKIEEFGGSLTIEDRPEITLYEIKNIFKETKYDLLIVDYADLITPPKKYKEKRLELVSVYQGLRKIAKEFHIPVWTASQLTARSKEKKIAGIEDLEESKIGKGGTASLVLTINQTPEEKEDNIARIFVAASTRGISGRAKRTIEMDFDTMTMREVKT